MHGDKVGAKEEEEEQDLRRRRRKGGPLFGVLHFVSGVLGVAACSGITLFHLDSPPSPSHSLALLPIIWIASAFFFRFLPLFVLRNLSWWGNDSSCDVTRERTKRTNKKAQRAKTVREMISST